MADIRKQYFKLKELSSDSESLILSNADMLRNQDALRLLEERGYIYDLDVDNVNMYRIIEDWSGFEEWLDEEYPLENKSNSFEISDPYHQFKKLMEQGRSCKHMIDTNVTELANGKTSYEITEDWFNDVDIFQKRYMAKHPLHDKINAVITLRPKGSFSKLLSGLESVERDHEFMAELQGSPNAVVPKYLAQTLPEYDVFISHANKDKEDFVDELNESLKKLGIKIFYDKEALEWGDNWKDRILSGVKKAEFAIIIISENFFDREWTEKELTEFLSRQNRNGQKIILPILHNISVAQLQEKYPNVADIQAIDSSKYSCDTIALKFAGQLIKRLKNA